MQNKIFKYVLLISILLVLTNCSPLTKYINHDDVYRWEGEIRKLEILNKTEIDNDEAIFFTGSSSIRLWDSIRDDMQPYSVIQRGYGGANLADFAHYLPRLVYPHNFKAIVIFLANDIAGTEKDKSPELVEDLFEYVVDEINDQYPDKPIFWIQVTPTKSRWDVWEKTKKSNLLIKDFCEDSDNLYFIETEDLFLDKNGLPKLDFFIDDELHLNSIGYEIWAKRIKEELNKVL